MAKILTILLVAVFGGMAVFSVFVMAGAGHGHVDCIALAINGGYCPERPNVISFALYHLNAFKNFSTAVFSIDQSGFAPAIFSLFLLAALFLSSQFFLPNPQLSFTSGVLTNNPEPFSYSRRKFYSWHSLHENSPAVL